MRDRLCLRCAALAVGEASSPAELLRTPLAPLGPTSTVAAAAAATTTSARAAHLSLWLPRTHLTRMQVELDGVVIHKRVLNDALFCHKSPAATTRYLIDVDGVSEEHKSSGLWVGPAAGSTAAQRSAGGRVLPPGSRKLQYIVREPYVPPDGHYRFCRGTIKNGDALRVYSKVREGRIFIDGPHVVHEVTIGRELVFRRSPESLTLLAFPRAQR